MAYITESFSQELKMHFMKLITNNEINNIHNGGQCVQYFYQDNCYSVLKENETH